MIPGTAGASPSRRRCHRHEGMADRIRAVAGLVLRHPRERVVRHLIRRVTNGDVVHRVLMAVVSQSSSAVGVIRATSVRGPMTVRHSVSEASASGSLPSGPRSYGGRSFRRHSRRPRARMRTRGDSVAISLSRIVIISPERDRRIRGVDTERQGLPTHHQHPRMQRRTVYVRRRHTMTISSSSRPGSASSAPCRRGATRVVVIASGSSDSFPRSSVAEATAQ